MKLGEIVSSLLIDPGKFRDYALNPENPLGKHKAVIVEQRLGYTQDNYEGLMAQIESQALEGEAVATKRDRHGQRYQVDLEVVEVEPNQREIVRTEDGLWNLMLKIVRGW